MTFAVATGSGAAVRGIRRVRFTTSHPRDFGRDIVEAIDSVPALCDHVHLPVQSGSTRGWLPGDAADVHEGRIPREDWLIRSARRSISVRPISSWDFPGETEEDVANTLAVEAAQYDGVLLPVFARRTRASLQMGDTIPAEEKGRRLALVQDRSGKFKSRATNETGGPNI